MWPLLCLHMIGYTQFYKNKFINYIMTNHMSLDIKKKVENSFEISNATIKINGNFPK